MEATIPFKNTPSFTSIARRDISLPIMEVLSAQASTGLRMAGPEVMGAGRPAIPRGQRFPVQTWNGPASLRASRVRQTPAAQRSHWSEDPGHFLVRGRIRRE